MKMGKHLFCEKPLANSVHEARVMRQVARETGVATQMGRRPCPILTTVPS